MRILFLLTIFILGSVSAIPQNNKRFALVIGNASYDKSPLNNPLNDADDISTKLNSLGFNVIVGKDCKTKRDIRQKLNEFCNLAKDADAGIFYYSGHGMQLTTTGENYLIPTQAEMTSEADVNDECIALNYILNKMEECGINMKVAIIDACRDNPFRTWYRGGSRGLSTTLETPSGTFIAFATSANNVAADGKERNSPFTDALLTALNLDNLEINNVFTEVKRIVKEKTNGMQRPWVSNDLSEHFYFDNFYNKDLSITDNNKNKKLFDIPDINDIFIGTEHYSNGTFKGEMTTTNNENIRYGYGQIAFTGNTEYVGCFNKQIHGLGIYTFANGDIFVGHWLNGKRTGLGVYFDTKGSVTIWKYNNEKIVGDADTGTLGQYLSENVVSGTPYSRNYYYKGDVLKSNHTIPHGFGVMIKNGIRYVGYWDKGECTFGAIIFQDGRKYIGSIQQLKMDGRGILVNQDSIQSGIWKNDRIITKVK